MATGTAKAPAYNVEASSTEVIELIPGKIKATFAGDIYIKSDVEQDFFCNIKHLTCLDKNRIVVVDNAVSTSSRFFFSRPKESQFRVKIVETTRKQVVSILDVPGEFSGMTTISDTRLAVCVDGNKIVLLRADKNLRAEKSVKFPSQTGTNAYEITHLSTYEDDLYICSGIQISKVDMMGKTTEIFKLAKIPDQISSSDGFQRRSQPHHFISSVMYTDGNKTLNMYAITVEKSSHSGRRNMLYLAHGTGTVGVKDKITTLVPGNPRSIVIDDEFQLLFVLIFVEQKPYNTATEPCVIYVLRPGTMYGCVLLGEDDGLQDVTSMAYCSKTRKLFVGSTETNYVNVYQLSSVP